MCEHPDFEQASLRAAEYFRSRGLRPAIIEKDDLSWAEVQTRFLELRELL